MIDAKRTMLVLLRDLVGCDFVRMRSSGSCVLDKIACSPINEEQLEALRKPADSFSYARSIVFDKFQFDIQLIHDDYAQIVVQQSEVLHSSEHKNNRKVVSSLHQQAVEVTFDLVSETDFEKWFIEFLEGQINETTQISRLYLTLSAIVQSYVIFSDYQKYTEDSLTKLHSRAALQSIIDANIKNGDIVLCMIHCQDFQGVNRKFGQARGDVVLNEIAEIIDKQTRDDDITCRFGGALFGVAMHMSDIEGCKTIANNLHQALQTHTFLNNALRLGFNIGAAMLNHSALTVEDLSASSVLIARAEQALRAAQSSEKPSFVIWEQGKFLYDEQEFDHLGGIFTPDNVTNYRNMLLLWDISSIIADEYAFTNLVSNVVERLAYTFEFSFAGVVSSDPLNQHDIAVATDDIDEIKRVALSDLPIYSQLVQAKTKAISSNKQHEQQIGNMRSLLVPLGGEVEECFFIVGEEHKFDLTRDSIMLFAGFARQIGKALKRSLLEEQLSRRLEEENATLVKELNELKSGLKSSALIYRSDAMQSLLKHTQRAAQTDTTVLITGESGTGKEKLIHALHSLSDRNNKPLVIVDCGSIPETLIESELFGHVKGAFTGANSDKKGKILAADGGILVLDEIGELPLTMQPKLLRFVQEKHFTPIGSTKQLKVKVKIVAVTNRNLLHEAEQGRFRKDLYYRLNVITLNNPPLRDRKNDIELLAKHFINKFCHQYDIKQRFLSDYTIERMKQYRWPGNIRQLENRLMQACLLSQTEEISFDELNLDPVEEYSNVSNEAEQSQPTTLDYAVIQGDTATELVSTKEIGNERISSDTSSNEVLKREAIDIATDAIKTNALDPIENSGPQMSAEQWTSALESSLIRFVSEIESSLIHSNLNIGETIESHLFKQLLLASKTNKQIAEKLNIPISTARRKAHKHQKSRIPSTLPCAWNEIAQLLDMITLSKVHLKEPLALLKQVVVIAVLTKVTSNMTRAASLIGVSEPTLYKFKKTICS